MFNQSLRYINSRWYLPKNYSHMVIYGQTRSGKSQTLKNCIEKAYLRGNCKIVDLYSAGADEGAYYSLKSNHSFWENREFKYGNYAPMKAQEFPTECLIPMCKNIPKEIPDIFKPFTIPVNSLNLPDLKAILGADLTKNEIALWMKIRNNFNSKTTPTDLLNYTMDAKGKKNSRIPGVSSHGISSIYNMFNGFYNDMLFSSENNELALNLKEILKNKKIITTLILKYFPEEYHGFLVHYFIHNIYSLVKEPGFRHNIILVMREAGDFLEGAYSSSQEEAVTRSLTHIVRKGAKNMLYFWIDNQTPMNLDVIKDEFGIKICHYVDKSITLQTALGDLGAMLLTKNDYANIATFPPGRCYVLTHQGLFNPQVFPPLSRMSGVEGNDFVSIWREEKGLSRFINIKSKIDIIKKEYEESELYWKNVIKERKLKKQQNLQNIGKIKEQEKEQKNLEKIQKIMLRKQEKEIHEEELKIDKNNKKSIKTIQDDDILEEDIEIPINNKKNDYNKDKQELDSVYNTLNDYDDIEEEM